MSTDETFLESFIESISTLPNELKRDLAHMKSLDSSCLKLTQELRFLEEEYLNHAHSIIHNLPVQSKVKLDRESKRCKIGEKAADSAKCDNSDNISEAEGRNTTSNSEDKNNKEGSDKSVTTTAAAASNNSTCAQYLYNPKQGIPVKTGTKKETVLVVPTTEELNYQIQNPKHLLEIAKLRKDARQLTEEKVAIANQTCSLIDSHIQRLDADLEKFENVLKNTGQYQETIAGRNGGIAKPDDLAAIQVTPNSPDWILAKVITHDPNTQMYKLADEDIESNKTFTLPESQVVILGIGGLESIRKGDVIYAVYPDTTSFYQATVVQGPKKIAGGGGDSFVLVNFKDDGDENGITHDKWSKYFFRACYDIIQ